MERFTKEHTTPLETSEKRPRFHEILLRNNFGNITAQAKLEYRNTVVPSYYISYLEVLLGSEDKKVGQELVATINHFLEKKGATGVLYVIKDSPKAEHIYKKFGWGSQKGTDFMFYNTPHFLSDEDKVKMIANIKSSWKRSQD